MSGRDNSREPPAQTCCGQGLGGFRFICPRRARGRVSGGQRALGASRARAPSRTAAHTALGAFLGTSVGGGMDLTEISTRASHSRRFIVTGAPPCALQGT